MVNVFNELIVSEASALYSFTNSIAESLKKF